jgi:hypothetical protein
MTMRINPPSKVGQRVQFGQYTGTVKAITGHTALVELDRLYVTQEIELVDLEVIV